MRDFKNRIGAIIKRVENSKTPFIYSVITFFAATALRHFLEVSSDYNPDKIFSAKINLDLSLHYNLFYYCLLLWGEAWDLLSPYNTN